MKTRLATAVILALATVSAPAVAHADTTNGGSFSVLSYNVAGLPEGISSAPTPRQFGLAARPFREGDARVGDPRAGDWFGGCCEA